MNDQPAPKPDFLYTGASKSGSTWFQKFCENHPQIFVPAAKDLFFFSDYYEKGWDWYLSHFKGAREGQKLGEICHDYFVYPHAMERIAKDIPNAKIIMFYRDPFARAVSCYKYYKRFGFIGTFKDITDKYDIIFQEGYYAKHLGAARKLFGSENVKVILFDDLKTDPSAIAKELCSFLEVDWIESAVPTEQVNKAALPRLGPLAFAAWLTAQAMRKLGLASLIGKIKMHPITQNLLFRKMKKEEAEEYEKVATFPPEIIQDYNQQIENLEKMISRDLKHWRRAA